jgi:site-specific DNA-methyltransferase (adenine-specific)
MDNTLYYGDNLNILRHKVKDESIDLIYLDPPFNSKTDYNILFKEPTGELSKSQIMAFEDTWHWSEESEKAFEEILMSHSEVAEMMRAFREFLKDNDVMAYLTMMCVRLLELQRVLKTTGSIYLHCDPTASHYLKILMDAIFGKKNFKNEIIWHYRKWPSGKRQFQRNHDIVLFYAKSDSADRIFKQIDFMERTESTLKRFGKSKIVSGHDENGNRLPSQVEDVESLGVPRDDVWDIGRVPPIKQLFPTQKPQQLLSRIIRASSNEGDVILDPFCGCGTTIVEAQNLKRIWQGIDITFLSISLIKKRLKDIYNVTAPKDYQIFGEPTDLPGALALKDINKHQFQWWAVSLVDGIPYKGGKKGADTGIDGYIYFADEEKYKKAIISVKSGHVGVKDIRELNDVVDREKAEIGVFITLESSTEPMRKEAIGKGFYYSTKLNKNFPKIQILTIEELFDNRRPNIPQVVSMYKKAEKSVDQGMLI